MSVLYDFSGKVALITGSSAGIGAATAILFSKSGAQVVVTGRNAQNVQSVAKQCLEVSPKSLKPLQVVADITKEEDNRRLVESTVDAFGKLDILVNNAGSLLMGAITDPDYMDNFHSLMNTNLNSVVSLTHKCVTHLERSKGNVINISSVSSQLAVPALASYSISKAALDMFTKCIAVQLGPKGIRVNSVNPGSVRTDILSNINLDTKMSNKIWDAVGAKYPVHRCGEGVDVANAILYLCSDQASFVTGTHMLVDGGNIAGNVSLDVAEYIGVFHY